MPSQPWLSPFTKAGFWLLLDRCVSYVNPSDTTAGSDTALIFSASQSNSSCTLSSGPTFLYYPIFTIRGRLFSLCAISSLIHFLFLLTFTRDTILASKRSTSFTRRGSGESSCQPLTVKRIRSPEQEKVWWMINCPSYATTTDVTSGLFTERKNWLTGSLTISQLNCWLHSLRLKVGAQCGRIF